MINSKSFKSIILYLAFFNCSVFAEDFPIPTVNVVAAQTKLLSPVSWVSGTVTSRNNSQIAAEVSGRLIALAELGDRVKTGDIIAQIDDKALQIKKREDEASVLSAKSSLEFLESEVKRKKSLAKRNLSSINDLDQTISNRDIANADLSAAKARLEQTEQSLSFSCLKAPFGGLITERLSNLGEYVNSGSAIIRLVETENLEASVFAPLAAYKFLMQRKTLAVESDLGNGMVPIKSLIPVADSRSHLMQVRLDMSSFDWPVGLSIKVAVANGETQKVLAIPRDALVLRREGISVFRINDQKKAEQISVKMGIGAGDLVEVIGAIKEGDLIVIRGAERLQAGQLVQIKKNNHNLISGHSL